MSVMLLVFGRSENGEIGLGARSSSRPSSLLQTTVVSSVAARHSCIVQQRREPVNMFDPQQRKMRANYVISSPFDEEDDAVDFAMPASAVQETSSGNRRGPTAIHPEALSRAMEAPTRTRVVRWSVRSLIDVRPP